MFHRCEFGVRRVLVLAVLIGCTLGAVPGRADDALDRYNLAVGLYKQERWELAADSFQTFVERYPDDAKVPTARLYWGLALINDKKYDSARQVLRDFAKAYPESKELPSAMYRIAEASYLLDDLKSAETEFSAFLKQFPEHELGEWALPYLGDTQLRLGQAKGAAATFQRALERFPKGKMAEDSRFGLAKAYEAAGARDSALQLYQQIAGNRSNPFAPQAQLNLGTMLFDARRYAEAAEAFVALQDQFPNSSLVGAAGLNAGYALYQAGDYQAAANQFARAALEGADAGTAGYWQGISQKALGDYAKAAAILKETYAAHGESALAEEMLYQWADSELRGGKYESAQKQFLQVVQRWPRSEFADDSLHFAAEAALMRAAALTDEAARRRQLDEAERLLQRFRREYRDSDLALHQELLRGRLLDARGDEASRKQAVELFRKVLRESTLARTQALARFHLARTLQKLGDHEEALESVAPLAEQARREGASSEFAEALILQGNSLLESKNYEGAAGAFGDYLQLQPDGEHAAQALAGRALAAAHRQDKQQVQADLGVLAERFSANPLLAQTAHAIAELAYEAEDFGWSADLFGRLVRPGPESSHYAVGLSGLAWSQYRLKNFDEAAKTFDRFVREFPEDPERTPEAAYMYGQALEEAGKTDEAIGAYADAFKAFAPAVPAGPGADQQRPERFAYLAGLQLARTEREQGDIEAADAAYARLLQKFPKPARGDYLLDEWALLHYEAEDYKRADELFRRLVEEYPGSDRADDARLNLAESDYIAGRIDAAERAFRGLESSEKSDELVRERALFQLIEIGAERQKWDDVRKLATDFGKSFPESGYRWTVQFRGAEADLGGGRLDAARDALLELKSKRAEPEVSEAKWFPRIWVLLAETYLRLKKYDDVVATVDELGREPFGAPVMHQAYEILGRSYKTRPMPEFAKAREAFQKVLDDPAARGSETAAKSQLMLAETYWLQKDYKQAQEAYLKVYHLYDFPQWQAPALFQAAACDEQLNRWSNAVKAYEELLKKYPESEMAGRAQERLKLARQRAARG